MRCEKYDCTMQARVCLRRMASGRFEGCSSQGCAQGGKLMDEMKECRICGQVKPVAEFGKNSGKKDKKRIYCLTCSRRKWRKNRWRRKRIAAQERSESALVLDFGGHPEVLRRLQAEAASEMRKPEAHALLVIARAMTANL